MKSFIRFFLEWKNYYYFLWMIRTLYYLSILLALVYFYGFVNDTPKTNFIYDGF
ncbi:teichoic acid D-Ala incorporation-associated protein DltX [Fodinisporobacter ferrooxydans]|uniref:teichoic acid D-Ala incorporation-associated protein DltX n=1 Tax=Fodinisporobacter ferrooxydans TaxID=2901836 RepID=UPI0032423960